MSAPFLGEIRLFGFGFAPKGWSTCDGQIVPITQNTALFSLLGTNYGGNGQSTFALPDMRSRLPVHTGVYGPNHNPYPIGKSSGVETVTLTLSTMPAHNHTVMASSNPANKNVPGTTGLYAAAQRSGQPDSYYTAPAALVGLDSTTISSVGGNQDHSNLQPYLVLNFCIATAGIYPSRN